MSKVTHLCFKYIESHASPLHLMFTINSIVYKYYNQYQILELYFFLFYFIRAGFEKEGEFKIFTGGLFKYICLQYKHAILELIV